MILVVPWGEFQPQVKPAAFNQIAFDRLGDVCRAAKAHGLQFYMRVSYLWDMYPGAQQPHLERTKALFSHDKLMPAWKQYLQRLNATTQGCADGAFISWEDFWHMIPLAASPKTLKESAFLSAQTGFDAWAKKHAEPHFRSKHAAKEPFHFQPATVQIFGLFFSGLTTFLQTVFYRRQLKIFPISAWKFGWMTTLFMMTREL